MLPISPLPRLYKDSPYYSELAQLVSEDGIVDFQSCRYCIIEPTPTTQDELVTCYRKNKCNKAQCYYAGISPVYDREIRDTRVPYDASLPLYFRVPQFRLVRIAGLNRYLQFVVCRATGYRCNSLCFYYSERMSRKLPASECSKNKGCNCNGSFWCLMRFDDARVQNAVDIVTNGHG